MSLSMIIELIAKYMNFMVFQKNASTHTQRAYQVDLQQAFGTLKYGEWKISSSGGYHFEYFPKRVAFPEKDLLSFCREAMGRWKDLSAASRNRKIACLKSFLGWLYAEEYIERDLADQLSLTKVPKKLPNYLSLDEALALLRTISSVIERAKTITEKEELALQEVLILLLYGGGLRISEACELRWRNFNHRERSLQVKGKGGKYRIVSLPVKVADKVAALPRSGPFIFGDVPLNSRKAYSIVRYWGQQTGLLKPLNPHALRHSYATHMLNSGANLRTLQSLLGHSSLAATEKYLHLGVDELARTLESHHPLARKPFNK